jgi:c-di-GMP-binding flagellar brake protein YcgR
MDRFFFGRSENISNSGILLSTDEAIEKGHNITCTFIIGDDLISVDGDVVRIIEDAPDRYSYGIQFINIDPFSKSKIDKLVGQQ